MAPLPEDPTKPKVGVPAAPAVGRPGVQIAPHDPIHSAITPMVMSGLGHIGRLASALDMSGRTNQSAAPSTGAANPEGAHLPEASGQVGIPQNTGTASADELNAHWRAAGVGGGPAPVAAQPDMALKQVGVAGKSPTQAAAISVPSKPGWQTDADPVSREFQRQIASHRQAMYQNNRPQDRQMHVEAMGQIANAWGQHANNAPDAQAKMLGSIASDPKALAAFMASRNGDNPMAVRQNIGIVNGATGQNPTGPGQVSSQNFDEWAQQNPAAGNTLSNPDLSPAEQYAQTKLLPGSGDPNHANHQAIKVGIQRQIAEQGPASFAANNAYVVPNPDAISHPMGDFGRGVTGFVNSINPWGPKGTSPNVNQWRQNYQQQQDFRQFMQQAGINPDTGQPIAPQ